MLRLSPLTTLKIVPVLVLVGLCFYQIHLFLQAKMVERSPPSQRPLLLTETETQALDQLRLHFQKHLQQEQVSQQNEKLLQQKILLLTRIISQQRAQLQAQAVQLQARSAQAPPPQPTASWKTSWSGRLQPTSETSTTSGVRPATNQSSTNVVMQVRPITYQSSTNVVMQVQPTSNQSSTNDLLQARTTTNQSSTNVVMQARTTTNQSSTNVVMQVPPTTNQSSTNIVMQVRPVANQSSVNVVLVVQSANLSRINASCVVLSRSSPPLHIFIHDPDQDVMSSALQAGKLWEETSVLHMLAVLKLNPDMGLVDVGASLGVYTLLAAAQGRWVLAVEVQDRNLLLLSQSLLINNLTSQVTLVKNAIFSNNQSTLSYNSYKHNLARSYLTKHNQSRPSVLSSRLDDLIPLVKAQSVFLRVDLWGCEHHLLVGGQLFFAQLNVKVVQIKWGTRLPQVTDYILEFMTRNNYTATVLIGISYHRWNHNFTNWTGNVLFFKKPS